LIVDSQKPQGFVSQQSTKDYQLLQTPGARIFDRSTSFASVTLDPAKKTEFASALQDRTSGECQSGSDREKTSSQKEE